MTELSTQAHGAHPAEDAIERDHRQVRALVARLADTEDVDDVAALLQELSGLLAPHFAMEEELGGLYDELRHQHPGLDGEIRRLEREHAEMLARLDELQAGFERLAAAGAQLRGRAMELALRLGEHERTEAQLIIDAHYQDIGVGD